MSPDVGTNVVDVYINYLRKKLSLLNSDADTGYSAIETVRGEGYQMASMKKMPQSISEFPRRAVFASA